MSYPLLCLLFLGVAVVVRAAGELAARRRGRRIPLRPSLLALAGLLVLTAVFDNLMIGAGLFTYADGLTSGVRVGLAPIEDFAYPVAAVLLLPALDELLRRRDDDD